MQKTITRRDILKFTGGGILGIMLSPLPWKLLDDSAIWTQNWSLTPPLPHGPITTAFSHCTLCSGGCAIKADCVSGMPYYLRGVQNHPLTHGTICTRGLASHHMAFHPLRIVHPHKFVGKSDNSKMTAVSLNEALDEIAKKIKESNGTIAILDLQPKRAISEIYREFLNKIPNGKYLTSPSCEDGTLSVVKEMMNRTTDSYGFDFENTSMVLSFGAPLFDGWGIPGRMTAFRNSKKAKIVQVDSRYSRTAMQSGEWIAIQPGTEKYLALNIAYVLIHNNLISQNIKRSALDFMQFKNIVDEFNPKNTSQLTGVDASVVTSIAHQLINAESAIVLSSSDPGGGPFDDETEKVIASLNFLIGNIGKCGGIISRREIPGYKNEDKAVQWSTIQDHSIGVLIIDGSDSGYAIPWSFIQKKLIPGNSFIVTLSPILNDFSAHADYFIPSPAHLESMNDVVTSTDSVVATFALSSPLLKRQENTTDPLDVVKEISLRLNIVSDIPTHEELLKQKVNEIYSQKRGSLFIYADQSVVKISELSSADEIWTKLIEGAVWLDEPMKQTLPHSFTLGLATNQSYKNESDGIQLLAYGWRGATSTAQISPILSKVFQETELRNTNGIVSVNPATAHQLGFAKNESATLTTINGSLNVRIKIESTVRPGIIEASIGPLLNGKETPQHPTGNNILNLCEVTNDGTWRITTANLLKV
ncbi:MAG: molybdopterin-dependent oxidoreductase [Bacteroidota bacterium]